MLETKTVKPNPDLDIEITYHKEGEYWIPDLDLPPQQQIVLNKFGKMRKKYLMEHKQSMYSILLIKNKLQDHLIEIQEEAEKRVELLMAQMSKAQGVTEELKANDMMEWVQRMNNIQAAAEEIVREELIYS